MLRRKLLASSPKQDPILVVDLAHPTPLNAQAHAQAFRVPVRWEKPQHTIQLNPQLFVQPLTPLVELFSSACFRAFFP